MLKFRTLNLLNEDLGMFKTVYDLEFCDTPVLRLD